MKGVSDREMDEGGGETMGSERDGDEEREQMHGKRKKDTGDKRGKRQKCSGRKREKRRRDSN